MNRKYDVNEIDLEIVNIDFDSADTGYTGGIYITWSSTIGFGNLNIYQELDGTLCADTECMDDQDDKAFTEKILQLLVEKLVIKG